MRETARSVGPQPFVIRAAVAHCADHLAQAASQIKADDGRPQQEKTSDSAHGS
jgi:hypothetical protein